MISFIHAKIYMAFEIILLNLFTHEVLLYRKLNNSKHPPVCKEFTSMDYLRLLVKMKHLYCLNRSAREGSWTISVKEAWTALTPGRPLQGSSNSTSNCNFSRPHMIDATWATRALGEGLLLLGRAKKQTNEEKLQISWAAQGVTELTHSTCPPILKGAVTPARQMKGGREPSCVPHSCGTLEYTGLLVILKAHSYLALWSLFWHHICFPLMFCFDWHQT